MHGRVKLTPAAAAPEHSGRVAAPCPAALRALVDQRLAALVAPAESPPLALNRAIRHALLAPGKRVRPLLAMLTAAEFGAPAHHALDTGCALEMIHTASLILDDLPCMDDAITRRGRACTHKAFGEATAILASISLLSRAFGVVAEAEGLPPALRANLTAILSSAAGSAGLAAGQERDLHDRTPNDTLEKIVSINHLKTGVLFAAAATAGGEIAGVDAACLESLNTLGHEVGLAFQALDDVIDVTQSPAVAGKTTGLDGGKATIASLFSPEEAGAEVMRHVALATAALTPHTKADGPLGRFIVGLFTEALASMTAAGLAR